jgi:hypothetical protein
MSSSRKAPIPNDQLVIYEPTNWEVTYSGQQEEQPGSDTIENSAEWLNKLFERVQKWEEDVCLLANTTVS